MYLDTEQLASLKEQLLENMTEDTKRYLQNIGGITVSTIFAKNEYKHMLGNVEKSWNRTGRCLEFDWCFATVAYLVWSDKLNCPVMIHIIEVTPKQLNKMVLRDQL